MIQTKQKCNQFVKLCRKGCFPKKKKKPLKMDQSGKLWCSFQQLQGRYLWFLQKWHAGAITARNATHQESEALIICTTNRQISIPHKAQSPGVVTCCSEITCTQWKRHRTRLSEHSHSKDTHTSSGSLSSFQMRYTTILPNTYSNTNIVKQWHTQNTLHTQVISQYGYLRGWFVQKE